MNYSITHFEIPSPDLQRSILFYDTVFGWKSQTMPDGKYAVFSIGDTQSGGGFDTNTKPAEQGVGPGLVINVDNIPEMIEKIKKAGGIITQDKTEIPGFGFYARFQDLNGNHMQIYSRT